MRHLKAFGLLKAKEVWHPADCLFLWCFVLTSGIELEGPELRCTQHWDEKRPVHPSQS